MKGDPSITNLPGQRSIHYRVGDFASFRAALLRPLPGEQELVDWRPATGDLALQLIEWWAYLADILTFYNEQIANGFYLSTSVPTALAPGETVATATPAATSAAPGPQLLTRLIGYRPRPGTGARGMLAAVVNGTQPASLPSGFAVQTKPGPGSPAQVFEAQSEAAALQPTRAGGIVRLDTVQSTSIANQTKILPGSASASTTMLLFRGPLRGVKANDIVILASKDTSATGAPLPMTVQSLAPETDPLGRMNTRVTLAAFPAATLGGDVTSFQLLWTNQSQVPNPNLPTSPKKVAASTNIAAGAEAPSSQPDTQVALSSTAPTIAVGDFVVVESAPASPASANILTLATVTATAEGVHKVQLKKGLSQVELLEVRKALESAVIERTKEFKTDQINQIIAKLGAAADLTTRYALLTLSTPLPPAVVRVHYGFHAIGATIWESPSIVETNATTAFDALDALPATLAATPGGSTVLVEDADGNGAQGVAQSGPSTLSLQFAAGSPASVRQPLRLLYNVFSVTEGRTVAREVLGSGDATTAGQTFQLRSSPLTYYPGSPPKSTLNVFVNGIPWTEAESFYGAAPDAQVFVVRRDPSQNTTVLFGDGVHGARLPTGIGNVTATYRFGNAAGQGAAPPGATTLATIVTPQPGLSSIRNPLAVTPGDAPATAAEIQSGGPASVQSFGRAVSLHDFEAIAIAAGAAWVRTTTLWNARNRRTEIVAYIDAAEGSSVFVAVASALAEASDPSRRVRVRTGQVVPLKVVVAVIVTPGWNRKAIRARVAAALETGPLSPDHLYVDRPPAEDLVEGACFGVDGVVGARARVDVPPASSDVGAVFTVPPGNLTVVVGVEGHA